MGHLRAFIKGVSWMSILRLLTRGLGFIKLAILARLLTPQDFGLFGIAALTLAFLEQFTQPGINLALIQQDEPIDKYVNTAWVVSIVRGLTISAVMFASAVSITRFFHQEDALPLLLLAATIPVVRGFINPAIVTFAKELRFTKEFALGSLVLAADATISVAAAFAFHSAIAFIYGMLVGAVVEVLLSFIMIKIRPAFHFVLADAKKLINFGKWITLSSILTYLTEQFDDIIVGRFLGATSLGIYQIAYKVGVLPSNELSQTVSKVTFPIYTQISKDATRLKNAMLRTTGALAIVSLPFVILVMLFPKELIRLFLGSQWLAAAIPLQVLVIDGFIRSVSQAPAAALLAVGRPASIAKILLFRFIIMLIGLSALVANYQLLGVAVAVVVSSLATMPLLLYELRPLLKKSPPISTP